MHDSLSFPSMYWWESACFGKVRLSATPISQTTPVFSLPPQLCFHTTTTRAPCCLENVYSDKGRKRGGLWRVGCFFTTYNHSVRFSFSLLPFVVLMEVKVCDKKHIIRYVICIFKSDSSFLLKTPHRSWRNSKVTSEQVSLGRFK